MAVAASEFVVAWRAQPFEPDLAEYFASALVVAVVAAAAAVSVSAVVAAGCVQPETWGRAEAPARS